MQKVEYYICETCGKVFESEKEAQACEDWHLRPKKIVRPRSTAAWKKFDPKKTDSSESDRCPSFIEVEMDDESVWKYELSRIYRKKPKAVKEEKPKKKKKETA